MKLFITIFVIAANLFFVSCKKTRTCTCDIKTTSTVIKTPRGSGQVSTDKRTTTSKEEVTLNKVKKDDLVRLYDCNSRAEKTADTYTTMIPVTTSTMIGGTTFTMTSYVVADASETTDTEYECEIK